MDAHGLQGLVFLGLNLSSATHEPFDRVVIFSIPLFLSVLRDKLERIMPVIGDTVWSTERFPNLVSSWYPK